MAVGKAEAQSPDQASKTGFSFVVPCLSSVDETVIKDHLARDHFLWLDLTAPTNGDIEKLRELFGFHPLALGWWSGSARGRRARSRRTRRPRGLVVGERCVAIDGLRS